MNRQNDFQPSAAPREGSLQWVLLRHFSLQMTLVALLLLLPVVLFTGKAALESEQRLLQADADKLGLVLERDRQALQGTLRDYAGWDDSYYFVNQPHPRYGQINFTGSFLSTGVALVAILRAPREPLLQYGQPAGLSSQAWQATLAGLPEWKKLPVQGEPQVRVAQVGGQMALLGVACITRSDERAPCNGLMVMVRLLDSAYLQWLGQLVGGKVTPVLDGRASPSSALHHARQTIVPLPGSTVLALQLDKKFDHGEQLRNLLLFACILLLLFGLAALWMRRFLRRQVLNRVELFAELAHRYELGQTVQWPVEGGSEIDRLAQSFNQMVARLAAAQGALQQQMVTDPLTGLGNRYGLELAANGRIGRCRNEQGLALLLVDLDGFKLVNDSLGHGNGDALLRLVAERMRQSLREGDELFRVAGDEFALLLSVASRDEGEVLPRRLMGLLHQVFRFAGHEIKISASAGIAYRQGELSALDLMRHADLALTMAKTAGKAQFCVYAPSMSVDVEQRLQSEQALRQALAEDVLEPYFQPVVDSMTGQVVSLEMLARWSHEGRMVSPAEFVPQAEVLGLIGPLFNQLLDKGMVWFAQFREQCPHLVLQVNLSALQFADAALARNLLAQLQKHGLPAEALAVELTESCMLQYPELVDSIIAELVAAGIGLHLDDFGTGYSSLARLRELPFDVLKLDRSFVLALGQGDAVLARAVHDFASGLGLGLIAEGVETEAERRALDAIGYRWMQGYLFARPMQGSEMLPWLSVSGRHSGQCDALDDGIKSEHA
ncbi:EAL domain-containing protein [Craterilacuibacter sp.]|uniref:EAL domain-containing protein n=1 Tax=Craterilacuibacter sp. TaxID=2870909 RepID=UPI003F30FC14